MHRASRGAGFREHVHRIGGDGQAVGPAEDAGVGVGAVLFRGPDDAGDAGEGGADHRHHAGRRASRGDRHHRAAVTTVPGLRRFKKRGRDRGVHRLAVPLAADEHAQAGRGQGAQGGEGAPRVVQPCIVYGMQRTQRGQHVVALQPVVAGGYHQVPVARIDTRIEDLHRQRAATRPVTHQAGHPGRRSSTADRQGGPWR